MLDSDIHLLLSGDCHDPFSLLGLQQENGVFLVRALIPLAWNVALIDKRNHEKIMDLPRVNDTAIFEGVLSHITDFFPYYFRVNWGGYETDLEDTYRFHTILKEMDLWLLGEGTHRRPYEVMGAHLCEIDGVKGATFAVWAPHARRVSVVGDFNGWDGRRNMMRYRIECGVWEIFIPHLVEGEHYKYEIKTPAGDVILKSDPYAFYSQLRPGTASIIKNLPPISPSLPQRQTANALTSPMSIYEVHLGSWKKKNGWEWLTYKDLAHDLVPYVKDLGFTHIELLPIAEHPLDASWGYQPVGLYAVTSRYGTPLEFRYFVDKAHEAGLGVILDWVPAHFPSDAHGLYRFDGTALYEHEDPREGLHADWGSVIYNYGRTEVKNYLVGNALFWIERYGIDGLRVDAVASMLYRDYSRQKDAWIPNQYGGRENLEAIDFIKTLNEVVCSERKEAITIAEESTSFPAVSRPTYDGGLGFHYKWNLGWMNDTLSYMHTDPIFRKHLHDKIRFSMMYAYNENFILPLSHDEVVHCKSSMIGKMPGDEWQRFANLRAYYGFMWAHPGKKLLFMGGEIGQYTEWNYNTSLEWHLLDYPIHKGLQDLIRDLNRVYCDFSAMHQNDYDPSGFQWICHDDVKNTVLSFLRKDQDGHFVMVITNFTPVYHPVYKIGAPLLGNYREIINTDDLRYGGSGVKNGICEAKEGICHNLPYFLELMIPPLATIMLVHEK